MREQDLSGQIFDRIKEYYGESAPQKELFKEYGINV